MQNEQSDDLRAIAVGETGGWRGPTAPRFSGLPLVPLSSPAPRRPSARRDLSHVVRSPAVYIGIRRPRHRGRRAIVVAAVCIAVMSVEFWALNRLPEAAPAPETGGSGAVAPLSPPPSPAAPPPTGTSAVTIITGTQEMAQAPAVSDNPTAGSGVADDERSRQVLPRPTDVQRDKPGLRQQPVRVRESHAVATAPTHVPKPVDVPAADAAMAAPYKGVLLVDSMPAGARVFVDRQLVGFTPIALPNVTAGSRVVRLEADAHETWSSAVRIVADEETRLSVQLNRTTR